MPAFCNCGRGERQEKISPKLGRPSYKGKNSGFRMTKELKQQTYNAYDKFKKPGAFLTSIFSEAMLKTYKCKTHKVDDKLEFFHPLGQPFPTFDQFRYSIHNKYGIKNVQKYLYGETRSRTKKTASKGSFSEQTSNLLEKIEGDAYYLKEVPRGPFHNEVMPPLAVVRLRDYLTGYICGIGFSFGNERAEAYKMALFSMAISKTQFCALFGIKISKDDWPGQGLSPLLSIDRGPGASKDLISDFEEKILITELAPSYQGQSKAIIESSHPKDIKFEGAPKWIKSNLNYVELAKREIYRTIRDNNRINISQKMTPETAELLPTPISLWNFYDQRYRTDAIPMNFNAAITNLLTTINLSVKENGVYIEGQRYDSDKLKESGLCERVINQGVYQIKGYTLGVIARKVWVEFKGALIEVDLFFNIKTHDSQSDLSLPMLTEINTIRKNKRNELREHRLAMDAEAKDNFEIETGKSWNSGTLSKGRPKRGNASARSEYCNLLAVTKTPNE